MTFTRQHPRHSTTLLNARAKCLSLRGFVFGAAIGLAALVLSLAARADQETFGSPAEAFSSLIAAARADDTAALVKIFGKEGEALVISGDQVSDQQALKRFVAAYDAANHIELQGVDRATLTVGQEDWPFPIPAVKKGTAWLFDTAAGKQEIIDRRIGRDELSAMEVCRAYVDAQREYATTDRNNDDYVEYAQKFASSPGSHDGLYWPAPEGQELSPLGPLVAEAQAVGYSVGNSEGKPTPYYGYYYKILKAQGPHARGGAYSYVVNGHMIGGFALVAYPAQYGVSGIMTFITNHDGAIYQANLGPDTGKIAEGMTLFDPDSSWTKQ